MSKEEFIPKKFTRSSMEIIERANAILEDYSRQGYQLTLRQLYYQFVTRNWVANNEKSYDRIGSIISDARLAGEVDWKHLVDRGRETTQNFHQPSIAAELRYSARYYRNHLWDDQEWNVLGYGRKASIGGHLGASLQRA